LFLSYVGSLQSKCFRRVSLIFVLTLFFLLRLGLPSGLFPSVWAFRNPVCIFQRDTTQFLKNAHRKPLLLFNSVFYIFLLLCLCIIEVYTLLCILFANWHSPTTLTENFPSFFLSCKANARDGARSALFLINELCCSVYCLCRLCCSVCCLCVNVYCTTATECQPNCSFKYIISYRISASCCVPRQQRNLLHF